VFVRYFLKHSGKEKGKAAKNAGNREKNDGPAAPREGLLADAEASRQLSVWMKDCRSAGKRP
jgi:hypothetical protein